MSGHIFFRQYVLGLPRKTCPAKISSGDRCDWSASILTSKGIKLLLYHSLFSSRLNYCQLVWGTTTVTNLNQVYLVQKKCVRHIFNAHFAASTNVLFCSSGIVKVHQIYNYTLSRKYKLETRKNITNLRVLANLGIRHLNYPTWHGENWEVDTARLNSGKESYTLPSLLNHYDLNNFDLFISGYPQVIYSDV